MRTGVWFCLVQSLVITSFQCALSSNTCVPAPKCGRRPHFGAVGIAGQYIGRLRNCLPFLTSFTQCRMANLHIKCFDINAYQRLECYKRLCEKPDHGSMRFGHIRGNVHAVRPNRLPQFRFASHHFEFLVDTKASFQTLLRLIYQRI